MPGESTVPREQYERVVACLGKAVDALSLATDALAAGDEMPQRAVLTNKLAGATHELRVAVGEAIRSAELDRAE